MPHHTATQSQMNCTSKMSKAVLGTNIITCITCSSKPAFIWKDVCLGCWKGQSQKNSKCIYFLKRPKRSKSSGLGNSLMQWKAALHWKTLHICDNDGEKVCVKTVCFHTLFLQTFYRCIWPSFLVLVQSSYSHCTVIFIFFYVYEEKIKLFFFFPFLVQKAKREHIPCNRIFQK